MYVPNYTDGQCAILFDSNIIRVYEQEPEEASSVDYTDYYYNSHYLFNTGSQYFSTTDILPDCRNDINTNFYYRTDITDIVFLTCVFISLNWFLISKLLKAITKGRRTI